MLFNKVTKNHILQGIKDFEEKGLPNGFGPSSTYDVVFEGEKYPPKAIMAYANYHAEGRTIELYFKDGLNTDCFNAFERNGFMIERKIINEKLYKLKQEFLDYWPLEKLQNMTLEEYTDTNRENSFCYWLEAITDDLGSIWGGSAYKFGIFKRRDVESDNYDEKRKSDGVYAWYGKYGDDPKVVFQNIKEIILNIVENTIDNNLEVIDNIDLGDAYKWKIAFMYGDFNVINIYKLEMLKLSAEILGYDQKDYRLSQLNKFVLSKKGDLDFFDFSKNLIEQFLNKKNEDEFKARINNLNPVALNTFFSVLDKFIENLKLENTQNLVFSTKTKRLSFQVGKRYCLNLKADSFDFIAPESHQIDGIEKSYFAQPDVASHFKNSPSKVVLQNYIAIEKAVKFEIERDNHTFPKEYDNNAFRLAAFNKEYRATIFNFTNVEIDSEIKTTTMNLDTPINKILFGPPGTGKTYFLKKELFDRYTLKEQAVTKEKYFEETVSNLTWWQTIALALYETGKAKVNTILENRWVATKAALSESKNVRATIWGTLQMHTIIESETVAYKQRQNPLIFDKTNDKTWQLLEDEVKEQSPEIFDVLNAINNFDISPQKVIKNYDFVTFHQSFAYEDFIEGIKPVFPETEEETKDLGYTIEDGVFKKLCAKAKNDPENRYAIFIDEINRGNVSAIFGELITLIETDKRSGAKNELSIKLPYSKKEFSVPSNLDIYGTMNTADRSVEALDTALRRRFEFKEMMPDYTVIQNETVNEIKLSEVLEKINERIELLIDRDHAIGHSYFFNVDSEEKLANAFNTKIVPLLQEYFYGDYGKIGLVLGNGFVEKKNNNDINFADFSYENANDFKAPSFLLKKVNEDNVIDAVLSLLGKKQAE